MFSSWKRKYEFCLDGNNGGHPCLSPFALWTRNKKHRPETFLIKQPRSCFISFFPQSSPDHIRHPLSTFLTNTDLNPFFLVLSFFFFLRILLFSHLFLFLNFLQFCYLSVFFPVVFSFLTFSVYIACYVYFLFPYLLPSIFLSWLSYCYVPYFISGFFFLTFFPCFFLHFFVFFYSLLSVAVFLFFLLFWVFFLFVFSFVLSFLPVILHFFVYFFPSFHCTGRKYSTTLKASTQYVSPPSRYIWVCDTDCKITHRRKIL